MSAWAFVARGLVAFLSFGPLPVSTDCVWSGSAWVVHIGWNANESGPIYPTWHGIDTFADVCRHDAQHQTDFSSWWPSGPPGGPPDDSDYDMVPDTLEPGLGYNPNLADTDSDGYIDSEDHALDNHPDWWNQGEGDDEDWANPGKQSQD